MAGNRDWKPGTNVRGKLYSFCEGEHVSLEDLKEDVVDQRYLKRKNIPRYPNHLFFNVSQVCHVTGSTGVQGIFRDGGFRAASGDQFLWWSLCVTDENISEAENYFLNSLGFYRPNYNQQHFLNNFTTSPAFQKESRYGNFRFTFQMRRLLSFYSMQFCYKTAPILRVFQTQIYQKEIAYSILVHPKHITTFGRYPRLPFNDPEVCGYSQGHVTWCCKAPSGKYRHRLEVDQANCIVVATPLRGAQYFVWDHVTLAFYMESNWTLRVHPNVLSEHASVCKLAEPSLLREPDLPLTESQATEILKNVLP